MIEMSQSLRVQKFSDNHFRLPTILEELLSDRITTLSEWIGLAGAFKPQTADKHANVQ